MVVTGGGREERHLPGRLPTVGSDSLGDGQAACRLCSGEAGDRRIAVPSEFGILPEVKTKGQR